MKFLGNKCHEFTVIAQWCLHNCWFIQLQFLNKSFHLVPLAWMFKFFLYPVIVSHFEQGSACQVFFWGRHFCQTYKKSTITHGTILEKTFYWISALGWSRWIQILLRKDIPLAWLRNGLCNSGFLLSGFVCSIEVSWVVPSTAK